MTLEIPVRSDIPSYEFKTDLENVLYNFSIRWNERMATWIMDIGDEQGVIIVGGIPLLTGINILGPYKNELLPPGLFVVYDETGENRNPTRENFGVDIKLLYQESTSE